MALRDSAYHEILGENENVSADDWWLTTLDNIEACECFVFVMTDKSLASIYCNSELDYALALNQPILPLVLNASSYPSKLNGRLTEYKTHIDGAVLDDVLSKIAEPLRKIETNLTDYPLIIPHRPPWPTPEATKEEQLLEVLGLAEESAVENNYPLAEKLYQQVIDADPTGLGVATSKRLAEVQIQRERYRDYLTIVQMAKLPVLRKRAQAAASGYVHKYGNDYDPNRVLVRLLDPAIAALPQPTLLLLPAPPPALPVRLLSAPAPKAAPAPRPPRPARPAPAPVKQPRKSPLPSLLPAPFAWVEIPAGKVTVIENNYDDSYVKKGQELVINVPTFNIAKYPITNAQYAKFVEANGYGERKWWKEAGWPTKVEKGWTEPRFWKLPQWNKPDYPVVAISWFEAMAYCKWLSEVTRQKINLPTEQQWQRAAQGDTSLAYPWGDEFDKSRCNFDTKATSSVLHYEGKGDSPFDVTDLSGNVWEWCATNFRSGASDVDAAPEPVVLRGGSYTVFLESLLRVNRRFLDQPVARNTDLGFRIVRTK